MDALHKHSIANSSDDGSEIRGGIQPEDEAALGEQTKGSRTRRCSEREPADSLGDESNIICGWIPSLTFSLEQTALMNAKEFNSQVDSVLAPILAAAGFKRLGSDFVRERDSAQLVPFRFAGSKFASLCQFTKFTLCFRHTFLRDIWEKIPNSHPEEPSGFPFRIRPSDLSTGGWQHWTYQFHLNAEENDNVEFGGLDDARLILKQMGDAVVGPGVTWASRFTVQESLRLLSSSSPPAFVERLWIEDYNGKLQPSSAANAG